jgi:hypothetical protein
MVIAVSGSGWWLCGVFVGEVVGGVADRFLFPVQPFRWEELRHPVDDPHGPPGVVQLPVVKVAQQREVVDVGRAPVDPLPYVVGLAVSR